ncbi:hypothetical protein GGR57DRAFT_360197 [Xylariaceae sp. FL1272]|nr:hypothetical protein GGR57DRAFT_360197 [Xylariaceae sp. FL1272]
MYGLAWGKYLICMRKEMLPVLLGLSVYWGFFAYGPTASFAPPSSLALAHDRQCTEGTSADSSAPSPFGLQNTAPGRKWEFDVAFRSMITELKIAIGAVALHRALKLIVRSTKTVMDEVTTGFKCSQCLIRSDLDLI